MCNNLQVKNIQLIVQWPVTKHYDAEIIQEEGVALALVVIDRIMLFDHHDYVTSFIRQVENKIGVGIEIIYAHKQKNFYEIVSVDKDYGVKASAVNGDGIGAVWDIVKEESLLRRLK